MVVGIRGVTAVGVQDRRGGVVDLLQDGRKAWTEQVRDDRSVKLTSQSDEVADNAAGGGPVFECQLHVQGTLGPGYDAYLAAAADGRHVVCASGLLFG